jgi:hypothetical protein
LNAEKEPAGGSAARLTVKKPSEVSDEDLRAQVVGENPSNLPSHGQERGRIRMSEIATKLMQGYEQASLEELAEAPVTALQGVSPDDAEFLRVSFNIKTVRDLGTNKYFRWAHAIVDLASHPEGPGRPEAG